MVSISCRSLLLERTAMDFWQGVSSNARIPHTPQTQRRGRVQTSYHRDFSRSQTTLSNHLCLGKHCRQPPRPLPYTSKTRRLILPFSGGVFALQSALDVLLSHQLMFCCVFQFWSFDSESGKNWSVVLSWFPRVFSIYSKDYIEWEDTWVFTWCTPANRWSLAFITDVRLLRRNENGALPRTCGPLHLPIQSSCTPGTNVTFDWWQDGWRHTFQYKKTIP